MTKPSADNPGNQPLGLPLNDGLGPLPEPPAFYRYQFQSHYGTVWRSSAKNWNGCPPLASEGLYSADQMRAYADSARRDCRTCWHFRGTQHCHSVLRCVDGSSYQRGGVVQLWEAAPVEPAPF